MTLVFIMHEFTLFTVQISIIDFCCHCGTPTAHVLVNMWVTTPSDQFSLVRIRTAPVRWRCYEIWADKKYFIIKWLWSAFQMLLCSISMRWMLTRLLFFVRNLWISILKEGRAEATRDPRCCFFAPLLLKVHLLQKRNKFPCNIIQQQADAFSLLFCYCYTT